MPIYEYICQDCGEKYEKLIRSSVVKVELKCPQCGSDHGERTLSLFGAIGTSSKFSSAGQSVRSTAPSFGPIG